MKQDASQGQKAEVGVLTFSKLILHQQLTNQRAYTSKQDQWVIHILMQNTFNEDRLSSNGDQSDLLKQEITQNPNMYTGVHYKERHNEQQTETYVTAETNLSVPPFQFRADERKLPSKPVL